MRARRAETKEYVEFFAQQAPADIAATIREQFDDLPQLAMTVLIDAWALADSSGREIEVTSVPPDSVQDFARNHRLRVVLEVDDGRIAVALSHLASHNPS